MTRTVREVVLRHPVSAIPVAADFEIIDRALPDTLPSGSIHVRPLWLGLDPYVGQRIRGRHMGEPAPAPGAPIVGESVAVILASADSDFAVGDHVVGHFGWAEESVVPAKSARKVDPAHGTAEHLGILGMPGLTAWVGATLLANIKPGSTFTVDAAAGLVGGTAGQIAKIAGARAVGIAGGAAKAKMVTDIYGFDACVDYNLDDWSQRLSDAAPDGIDTHFENVGQRVLDVVIPKFNLYSQLVLCGLAGHYGDGAPATLNVGQIMGKRTTVRGVIVYDYFDRRDEWIAYAVPHLREGRLVEARDIAEGLEGAPLQIERVAAGTAQGRPLVRIAAE